MQTEPGLSQKTSPQSVRRTFSERLWNFSWNDILPKPIGSHGVQVEACTLEVLQKFGQEHFHRFFFLDSNDSAFLHTEDGALKMKYYEQMADVFCHRLDGKIIAVSLCQPGDWNSYYVRHHSILEPYRGLGITQQFFQLLVDELGRHGVKRIQMETAPANFPIISILTRLKFNITGSMLSERWGNTLYFTKFLDPLNKSVFLKQFCFGNNPQELNKAPEGATKNGERRESL